MHISSPGGGLESRHQPAEPGRGIQAVLCHPHPQYGGTMDDPVVDCLARTLLGAGIGVLRFNFRGVGGSPGRFDEGVGETDDLLAAVSWLRETFPNEAIWAGGYSFGAWITWQAMSQGFTPDRAILVAPPTAAMTFAPLAPACTVDAVAGDRDDYVDSAALGAWPGVTAHPVAGADHFFSGRHRDLLQVLAALTLP